MLINTWDTKMKKYTSSSLQAASDQDSINDSKSISSFNDLSQLFETNKSTRNREQQMEKDFNRLKEKLQTADKIHAICRALNSLISIFTIFFIFNILKSEQRH